MDIGYVHSEQGRLLGSLRAYDITAWHYPSFPTSPTELMFKERGYQVKSIQALREKYPNDPIFEMGNFLIEKSSPLEQLKTKASLLQVWLEKFPDRFPNAHFVGHVASDEHARLYLNEYGFNSIESIWMPDIESHEQILHVDAKTLALKLRAQIQRLKNKMNQSKPSP